MLAVWVHQLTPFIPFTFHLLRWYGFAYLMGFVAAYLLLRHLIRRNQLPIPEEKLADLVLFGAIFGVILGGRLGYVLFYGRELLFSFSKTFPFWGVLRVNNGGMSAHGGIIGVILALAYFGYKHKIPLLRLGDAACMTAPVGIFFGRIANFINGELYGHITNVPWAVKFPQELLTPPPSPLEPTVAQVQIDQLINAAQSQLLLDPTTPTQGGQLEQIISLAQQHNPFILNQLAQILPARHPSQLYEALMEGLLLFAICWTVGRRTRRVGMAGGAFLTFYPVMRILGEQFRVGDDPSKSLFGWHPVLFGQPLSLGVLYSVPLFFIGLGLWIYWATRPLPATETAAAANGLVAQAEKT